jgi:nucleotidyltransferase substrate binding protein (TIGR01987 family)
MVQRAGLIHLFEISFELSWKVMKGHLEAGGYQNIRSPRDAIEQFYDLGLIHDDTQWLQGLEDRDLMAYTYNDANAHKVILLIRETYYPLMADLEETLKGL